MTNQFFRRTGLVVRNIIVWIQERAVLREHWKAVWSDLWVRPGSP